MSLKSVRWEQSCSMQTDERTDGQTGKNDEANSHFLEFCERF